LRRHATVLFGGLLVLGGCSGHTGTMHGVREALLRNDLDEARARLADAGRGTDDLLFALEDGLLLHYAGDPELSNARLEFAEQRVDDLYTKSVSRAALSLVTSDLILRFEPRGIDNFLVNYYRALNYLQLGQGGEAQVEWRKLNSKLQFSRQHGDAPYLDPPFFNHLAGLGLEAADPNDAYVSLRLAEAAYEQLGREPPADLVDDLLRLAAALGFGDHLEMYRQRYAAPGSLPAPVVFSPGRGRVGEAEPLGEIVVLLEDGLVAPIEEIRAYIPVAESRAKTAYEGNRLELAALLAEEYRSGRYDRVRSDRAGRGIAYVMPLSFPVFGVGYPAFEWAEASAGENAASARIALDLSGLQRVAFESRLLGIYAKTIARALFKWAAAAKLRQEAEEEHGETVGDIVGFLANAVNVATERADTRAWLGLPHRIWMARLRVPPGSHEVRVNFSGVGEVELGTVVVRPGERVFISYRVF
jgi:hypothetical protein